MPSWRNPDQSVHLSLPTGCIRWELTRWYPSKRWASLGNSWVALLNSFTCRHHWRCQCPHLLTENLSRNRPVLWLLWEGSGCLPDLLWEGEAEQEHWQTEDGALPSGISQQPNNGKRKMLPFEYQLSKLVLLLCRDPGKQSAFLSSNVVFLPSSWLQNQFQENLFFRVCLCAPVFFSPPTCRFLYKLIPFSSWKPVEEVLGYKIFWSFKLI